MGWSLGLGWLAGVGVWLLCFRSRFVDCWVGFGLRSLWLSLCIFSLCLLGGVGLVCWERGLVWDCRLLGLLVFLWYVL